jgi:hypothetical protein
MARKTIPIDWEVATMLCGMQCTKVEVAAVLKISEDTLERALKREKNTTFSEFYEQHQASGKASLRRMQWESARNGNVTMQIWLGKQVLGQTDRTDISGTVHETVQIVDDIPAGTEAQ